MLVDINTLLSIFLEWFVVGVGISIMLSITIAAFTIMVGEFIDIIKRYLFRKSNASILIRTFEYDGKQYLVTNKGCICQVTKVDEKVDLKTLAKQARERLNKKDIK